MKQKKVLYVVDVQNDFINGSLGTKEAVEMIPKLVNFLQTDWIKENVSKIVVTKDTHYLDTYSNTQEGRKLPIIHCIKGRDGHNVHRDVMKQITLLKDKKNIEVEIIEKETFGTPKVYNPNDNFNEALFVGICTDICVISNVLLLKALNSELEISVIADLCVGLTPDTHVCALSVMKNCQVNILNSDFIKKD